MLGRPLCLRAPQFVRGNFNYADFIVERKRLRDLDPVLDLSDAFHLARFALRVLLDRVDYDVAPRVTTLFESTLKVIRSNGP